MWLKRLHQWFSQQSPHGIHAAGPIDPGAPPLAFNIPLRTNISVGHDGKGRNSGNDIKVSYAAFDPTNFHPVNAAIAFNAPIVLDVQGGADAIGVVSGQASTPAHSASPPVLNSLFSMRLDGGDGKDTVAADLYFAASSRGFVDAAVLGGRGNNDLTLNVYGITDELVRALIDGGPGWNTAHHTPNVMVRHGEVVH